LIKVVVVAADSGDEEFLLQGEGLLDKDKHRSAVIEMDDFISSLIQAMASSINSPSHLKIEIGGTIYIAMGTEKEEKIVCFNVLNNEDHSNKEGLMKLTIETEVSPAKKSDTSISE
jgi:hypothetical protein